MKIYFLSSQQCQLTLNGAFFGITDRFERFAEIDLADCVFAEFKPENAMPVSFFITEELLQKPPRLVRSLYNERRRRSVRQGFSPD